MYDNSIIQLKQGLSTAFIDSSVTSNLAYKPQFVSNNYKEGRKVLSSIEEELSLCDEFFISVAFITMSGITPLLQVLKELEQKEIPGRILTTDYLMFSEPKALDKLANLKNIELKMYNSEESGIGFHTKGYVFREKEIYRIIVGSSNMTLNALTKNKEWNTRLVSTKQGGYAQEILSEFMDLWDSIQAIPYGEFIENYRIKYDIIQRQKQISRQVKMPSIEQYRLQPNTMQVAFIRNLRKMIDCGEERALLISATGERVIIVIPQGSTVNTRASAA